MADTEKSAAEPKKPDLVFELTTPILSYGEEIKVLNLRKPTGADLIRIGNPVLFTPHVEPPRVEHDMPRMVTMIATLSNTPSSSIATMDPKDLIGLAWSLSPFFIPAL